MKSKFVLSTTTALAMMMGAAIAADNNRLYIDQAGTGNVLHSSQSGNNNLIGDETNTISRAVQDGTYSTLEIVQSGNNNIGSSRNRGIDQRGNHGYLRLEQTGSYNETAGMQQFGSYNDMRAYQQSNGNYIYSMVQSNGGLATTMVPANAMQIVQRGSDGNVVNMANQNGMGNRMYLTQDGAHNTILSATQGVFNTTTATNAAMNVTQHGDYNVVNNATQEGDHNSATLNINGSYNGFSAFGSSVASGVAGSSGISQGGLHQSGIGNIINVGFNANDTSFSFDQTGNYDQLSGNVNFGTGNELATRQHDGQGNSIGFQVGGDNNVIGFDQSGAGNSISAAQTGNSNVASMNQSGTGNVSTISQQ